MCKNYWNEPLYEDSLLTTEIQKFYNTLLIAYTNLILFNNDFGTNLKCFYQTQLSAIHFSSMSVILDIIFF